MQYMMLCPISCGATPTCMYHVPADISPSSTRPFLLACRPDTLLRPGPSTLRPEEQGCKDRTMHCALCLGADLDRQVHF